MYKFLIVGVCFTVVALSEGFNDEYKKFVEECKAETGGSDADLKFVMSKKTPTEKGWCLAGCIHKKTGTIGPDNKLIWDKFLQQLDSLKEHDPKFYAKFVPAMQQCKDQTESNAANLATACTATKAVWECVKPKVYLLFENE